MSRLDVRLGDARKPMTKRRLLAVEIALLIATLVLAILWACNPAGNFEPFTIVCGVMIAVIEVIRRTQSDEGETDSEGGSNSNAPIPPANPAAVELLDLIRSEEDPANRGLVEICKEVEPGRTYFFSRLKYAGSPSGIASRHFRTAVDELVQKNWLYPPVYNESTDTITYEFIEDSSGEPITPTPATSSGRRAVLIGIGAVAALALATVAIVKIGKSGDGVEGNEAGKEGSSLQDDLAAKRDDPLNNDERSSDVEAPLVTFTDGSKAIVEFSLVTSIQPENAPKLVAAVGDRKSAMKILSPQAEAELIAQLELIELQDARTKRSELEDIIQQNLAPKFLDYGITLDSFDIRSIKEKTE